MMAMNTQQGTSRQYVVGKSSITLARGDITTSTADVLVSSDDTYITMGGGVSAAIRVAGGTRIMTEATKMVPARVGDVVVTTAGDLSARYVFHAITLGFEGLDLPGDAVVRQTTRKALQLLPSLGCRSIAFPAIGAGVAGIPYETVATQMATTIVSFLLSSPMPIQVELCLHDPYRRMNLVRQRHLAVSRHV